ncbi:hypothetical protein [Streptomyces sp. NPDC059455]|uniref:hypothetical protein n=1 Tax=Streptomyces sp. NPDC059455 TaxID=3346837 RepID=UPI0036C26FA3
MADHNRLRKLFHEGLTEPRGKRTKPYLKGDLARQAADELAWTAASSLMYGHDHGFIPHSAVHDVLTAVIVGHLTEDLRRRTKTSTDDLTPFPASTVKLLTWYIQHRPSSTASLLGEVCLEARVRLDLDPAQVGATLRQSLHFDSSLDRNTINRLLDMALPPSARPQ